MSEYEQRVWDFLHQAMPWRKRAQLEWRDYHRNRLALIHARLDAALGADAEKAKDVLRELL